MGPSIDITEEFSQALDHLNSGHHLFLTGKAGTGKSTLIRHYIDITDRNVIVTAPTGIAALNVNGYTLHRLFSLSPTTTLEDVQTPEYYPGRFSRAIKTMETLIIDEASMIRADLFDVIESALRRFGRRPGEPFGGVQLVLVGDLAQLPPVVTQAESEYFTTRYETSFFFSADTFSRDAFPTVELTKVFRQAGDPRMTAILNAIREGVLPQQTVSELSTRVVPDFEPCEDDFWLTLGATNSIVSSRNRRQLDRLPSEEHLSRAITHGDLSLFDFSSAEEELRYKIGAQVMMLTNDSADRWVNGTLGRITGISETEEDPRVSVELRGGATVDVGRHTWEVTRPITVGTSLKHEVVGTFTQLPFKLAWAITIHKSQGQTLDHLIVDLAGGAFASGQVYVALSRCTSLEGLILKQPVRPKDLKIDRRVLRFVRETTQHSDEAKFCAIATLSVGNVGRMWRPRPVELALAFDDGSAMSVLINPESDLFDAKDSFDITVPDILLAPSLSESWSILGPMLTGWTPVGIDVDLLLEHIDFELKRNGVAIALPVGVSIPRESLLDIDSDALSRRTALSRAEAILAAFRQTPPADLNSSPFTDASTPPDGAGFFLTRDPDTQMPHLPNMPALDGLTQVSRELSAVILRHESAAQIMRESDGNQEFRKLVGQGFTDKVTTHLPLPSALAARLPEVDALLGTSLTSANSNSTSQIAPIEDVLLPGTTYYISGTPHTPQGEAIEKSAVAGQASARGLVYTDRFGKKLCQVLIVAEEGSQSRKSKQAKELGKPVFSIDEFWRWLENS